MCWDDGTTLESPKCGGGVTLKPAPGSMSSSLRSGPNVLESGRVINCLICIHVTAHISVNARMAL